MVPPGYASYFAASATAAAALIGLLFVAVSVRENTVFGEKAMPGGEPLAITAFAGLVAPEGQAHRCGDRGRTGAVS